MVASVAGISAGSVFLVRKYYSWDKRVGERLTGKWTNEGGIDSDDSHCVNLELTARKHNVDGILNVHKYDSETRWNNVSVSGKRKFTVARMNVIHVRDGKVSNVGTFKLKLKGDNLHWHLINGVADFFPRNTILWRMPDDTAAD